MVLDRRENTKRKLEVLSGYAGNLYCTYMYMRIYMKIWFIWLVLKLRCT